ncbi:GPO family capsid scaffolding protein [Herbaspirillum chlorophenolicum]|uniref:GPO family capsid scaffolding protein n=1 Tax=Herbaspirillum chlorophenolicum TaxID=211589 RepID=A0ABW8F108_9BURK
MAIKSKFFRVATEGATTDGRNISREQISQMAANYNPKVYGARIWLEHYRGIMPEGPFKAYGDVLALKAEEEDIGNGKRMALFAQIEPTPDLVAMNKQKQKVYTSIEINPKFADTGAPYFVGLGVTDTPASLGTDFLQFSASKPELALLSGRKQAPDNVFSEATEVQIEFEESGSGLADTIKQMFSRITGAEKKGDALHADAAAAVTVVAEQVASFAQTANGAAEGVAELRKKLETLEKRVNDESSNAEQFRQTVNLTDKSDSQRPPATGGKNVVETAF